MRFERESVSASFGRHSYMVKKKYAISCVYYAVRIRLAASVYTYVSKCVNVTSDTRAL